MLRPKIHDTYLLNIMFDCSSYSKFLYKYYLFCYDLSNNDLFTLSFVKKKLNKINGQTLYLKVKGVTGTEGVFRLMIIIR